MFDQDALHQRGKALEDEFFRQVDQKLLADLKASSERERHIEQLASVTSFQDDELLADLVDGGFQPATAEPNRNAFQIVDHRDEGCRNFVIGKISLPMKKSESNSIPA